ncbi:MAG: glycoside hydrolase, partial [Actinomycetota bacterium]|nr:glycoside hydrolase [Actinomycetota bacterium]
MRTIRSLPGAVKRPLVALVAAVIVMAPFLVVPASAVAACGTVSGYWTTLAGPTFPSGGRAMTDHAVDARSPSRLFATNGTVVMRSTDSGCSWSPVYELGAQPGPDQPFTNATADIHSLVVPEGAPGRVLLTIEETVVAATRPHVVVSSDAGSSWTVGDSGLPPLGSPEIVVAAPSSPNVVYLGVDLPSRPGTVDGLFASADGGVTWQARSQRLAGGIVGMTVDNLVPTELWAYGSSGLHHSTNGGTTFTPVDDFVGESAGPVDVFRLPGRPPRVLA